jgi:hypothetical protein
MSKCQKSVQGCGEHVLSCALRCVSVGAAQKPATVFTLSVVLGRRMATSASAITEPSVLVRSGTRDTRNCVIYPAAQLVAFFGRRSTSALRIAVGRESLINTIRSVLDGADAPLQGLGQVSTRHLRPTSIRFLSSRECALIRPQVGRLRKRHYVPDQSRVGQSPLRKRIRLSDRLSSGIQLGEAYPCSLLFLAHVSHRLFLTE